MGKRSPRLQFTEEERAAPKLKKTIHKADKRRTGLKKPKQKSRRKPLSEKNVLQMPMAR